MKDLPVRPTKRDRAVLEPFLRRRDVRGSMRGARVLLDVEDHRVGSSSWFELGASNPALEARPVDDLGSVVVKSGEVLAASGHRLYALLILALPDHLHLNTKFVFPSRLGHYGYELADEKGGVARAWGQARAVSHGLDGLDTFPYAYRYFDRATRRKDPHVDSRTGWSEYDPKVYERLLERAREVEEAMRQVYEGERLARDEGWPWTPTP